MEYYEALKAIRIQQNISQDEAAKTLHTTRQQLYKYETGKQEMTVSRLITLCKLYHISADELLGLIKED